ncbi:hypothetical protein OGM63_05185 [Plectonema radiosum NIES-515]|uniref:Uncharacterized protein n=1 Tax=Plectonema radiosum NIES-515 TaxID=2986073 RepID=A0ABT3AV10_9CYAN|nr:hypothetical protein [Plectonema radiosum]MCV3212928.1 hypothetical protein [Plectonema radiosum NIES-515]
MVGTITTNHPSGDAQQIEDRCANTTCYNFQRQLWSGSFPPKRAEWKISNAVVHAPTLLLTTNHQPLPKEC